MNVLNLLELLHSRGGNLARVVASVVVVWAFVGPVGLGARLLDAGASAAEVLMWTPFSHAIESLAISQAIRKSP